MYGHEITNKMLIKYHLPDGNEKVILRGVGVKIKYS